MSVKVHEVMNGQELFKSQKYETHPQIFKKYKVIKKVKKLCCLEWEREVYLILKEKYN